MMEAFSSFLPSLIFLSIFGILSLKPISSTSILPDLDKPYKTIFARGESERDLEECQSSYAPCNLIKNPFFFPFIVKRLCRCKSKECPDTFELKRSLDTVLINNREQMKFCDDLPKCNRGWSVLRVGEEDGLPYHLNCFCQPKKRYWKLLTNPLPDSLEKDVSDGDGLQNIEGEHTSESDRAQKRDVGDLQVKPAIPTKFFKCEKMEPCEGKPCGTMRSDLYATYQNCTCPNGSLCLPAWLPSIMLTEALYAGKDGRSSTCVPSQSHLSLSKKKSH